MPITRAGESNIERWIATRAEAVNRRVIAVLHRVGLEATTVARTSHRYLDQTGNLTSSIGYIVVQDGVIQGEGDYNVIKQGGEGSARGRRFAQDVAKEHPQGTYLIIVAGMPYATYVEALGLNVLDSAKVHAKTEVPNKIRQALKGFVK